MLIYKYFQADSLLFKYWRIDAENDTFYIWHQSLVDNYHNNSEKSNWFTAVHLNSNRYKLASWSESQCALKYKLRPVSRLHMLVTLGPKSVSPPSQEHIKIINRKLSREVSYYERPTYNNQGHLWSDSDVMLRCISPVDMGYINLWNVAGELMCW